MGPNPYTSMTFEEFWDQFLQKLESPKIDLKKPSPKIVEKTEDRIDWRNIKDITPVRQQ